MRACSRRDFIAGLGVTIAAPLAVAIVDLSWKAWNPPYGPLSEYTFVLCEYSPVRIVVRLGQQSGLTRNASANRTPWAITSR